MVKPDWTTLRGRVEWAIARKNNPSKAAIAKGVGVTRHTVYLWTDGTSGEMKPDTYQAAALYFDVNRDWLETGTGEPVPATRNRALLPAPQGRTITTEEVSTFSRLRVSDQRLALALLETVGAHSALRDGKKPRIVYSRLERAHKAKPQAETDTMTQSEGQNGQSDRVTEGARKRSLENDR